MKQLETRNQKIIMSAFRFYKEIGIDTLVLNKNIHNNSFSKSNKIKDDNIEIKDVNFIKNKDKEIKNLENSFKDFDGCNLKKLSKNFVNFFGNSNSKLLIIDGPPDIDEDKTGVSFVSNKGSLLEKMLNAIKLKKDDFFIVKSIPWRPPGNRYPTKEELKTCRPFIINLIKILRPKIIVCLGEIPTNQLLELDESIIKVRGKWRLLKSEKIYRIDELKCDFNVLPTLSISHLLIRPDLKKYAWNDMKLLRDKIKEIL